MGVRRAKEVFQIMSRRLYESKFEGTFSWAVCMYIFKPLTTKGDKIENKGIKREGAERLKLETLPYNAPQAVSSKVADHDRLELFSLVMVTTFENYETSKYFCCRELDNYKQGSRLAPKTADSNCSVSRWDDLERGGECIDWPFRRWSGLVKRSGAHEGPGR